MTGTDVSHPRHAARPGQVYAIGHSRESILCMSGSEYEIMGGWARRLGSGQIWFGGEGGGETNERPGTDHVISGPMIGLEKNWIRWR